MKKVLIWIGVAVTVTAIASGAFWLGKKQGDSPDTKNIQGSSPTTQINAAAKDANSGSQQVSAGSNANPGIAVEIMKVQSTKLAQSITAVGSLRSDESVVIRPEVAGRIAEILFSEGARVVACPQVAASGGGAVVAMLVRSLEASPAGL